MKGYEARRHNERSLERVVIHMDGQSLSGLAMTVQA